MFLTIPEIIDMFVISAALGYIFSGAFHRFAHKTYENFSAFDWEDFKFAASVTAPGIILHELGHKVVALLFGLAATFQAAYLWLAIGVIMKVVNFPFLFFVPAFVEISSGATPLQSAIIAFAGPAVNGILWLISHIMIKANKVRKKYLAYVYVFRYINGFLFVFNMIPIPPFDGGHVVFGLFKAFF